jgi:hypothetical protein
MLDEIERSASRDSAGEFIGFSVRSMTAYYCSVPYLTVEASLRA